MPVERSRPFGGAPRFSGLPRATPGTVSGSPAVSRATQLGLGLGKGAVGLGGKGTSFKRHKKLQKDTIRSITKGDIRRLARRGGVKRMSAIVYPDIRAALKDRLERIMRHAVSVVEYTGRKTVTVTDIIFVLNQLGNPLYGFDPAFTGIR